MRPAGGAGNQRKLDAVRYRGYPPWSAGPSATLPNRGASVDQTLFLDFLSRCVRSEASMRSTPAVPAKVRGAGLLG